MSEDTKAPDAVPEKAIRSAASFVVKMANQQTHTAAVADCRHCNLNFLVLWSLNLLTAFTEANRKLAEAESQVQSENAELKTAYAQLARKEREMLVLRETCIELSQFLVGYDDVAEIAARRLRQALVAQEALSREGQDGGAQ